MQKWKSALGNGTKPSRLWVWSGLQVTTTGVWPFTSSRIPSLSFSFLMSQKKQNNKRFEPNISALASTKSIGSHRKFFLDHFPIWCLKPLWFDEIRDSNQTMSSRAMRVSTRRIERPTDWNKAESGGWQLMKAPTDVCLVWFVCLFICLFVCFFFQTNKQFDFFCCQS